MEKNFHKLKRKFPIIVYCQKGMRSSKVAEVLLKNGYEKIM
ncbi:rhodanese-like domain-containing protein [Bacteroidetes bacterium endosymbiont of Geopemphigus sp.]